MRLVSSRSSCDLLLLWSAPLAKQIALRCAHMPYICHFLHTCTCNSQFLHTCYTNLTKQATSTEGGSVHLHCCKAPCPRSPWPSRAKSLHSARDYSSSENVRISFRVTTTCALCSAGVGCCQARHNCDLHFCCLLGSILDDAWWRSKCVAALGACQARSI